LLAAPDRRAWHRARDRHITLADVVAAPPTLIRVRALAGDLADPAFVDAALDGGADSVFHLAAVVSGEAGPTSTSVGA
jgi:nucleoside-diphosphate-sugar epimerase